MPGRPGWYPVRAMAVPASGNERFGDYRLLRRLGKGGMAEVFLARRRGAVGFEKTLVVKRILPQLAGDPSFVKMFIDEAKLSAELHHPNIVEVYDLGEIDGRLYIAMEYVAGKNLHEVLRAAAAAAAPLEWTMAAHLARETARALHHAHEHRSPGGAPLSVIHRDVSPSNVMVGHDGVVKLLDFGIAKAAVQSGDEGTRTGTVKGKFSYMAPEQLDGLRVDRRADVFALGVLLWELATGVRLFRDGVGVQLRVLDENARRGQSKIAARADGDHAVVRLHHVAATGDDQEIVGVGDNQQRFEPPKHTVGAPVLGQLHRRAF